MQKIEYGVCCDTSTDGLVRQVQNAIAEGFEPQGGLCITSNGMIAQALIRKTPQTDGITPCCASDIQAGKKASQSLKQQDDGGRG